MIPNVINEKNVNRFCYWDEKVCQGILYEGELYRYVNSYPEQERVNLFLLGMKLTQQGRVICITRLNNTYSLWLALRLPSIILERRYRFQPSSPPVSRLNASYLTS